MTNNDPSTFVLVSKRFTKPWLVCNHSLPPCPCYPLFSVDKTTKPAIHSPRPHRRRRQSMRFVTALNHAHSVRTLPSSIPQHASSLLAYCPRQVPEHQLSLPCFLDNLVNLPTPRSPAQATHTSNNFRQSPASPCNVPVMTMLPRKHRLSMCSQITLPSTCPIRHLSFFALPFLGF